MGECHCFVNANAASKIPKTCSWRWICNKSSHQNSTCALAPFQCWIFFAEHTRVLMKGEEIDAKNLLTFFKRTPKTIKFKQGTENVFGIYFQLTPPFDFWKFCRKGGGKLGLIPLIAKKTTTYTQHLNVVILRHALGRSFCFFCKNVAPNLSYDNFEGIYMYLRIKANKSVVLIFYLTSGSEVTASQRNIWH